MKYMKRAALAAAALLAHGAMAQNCPAPGAPLVYPVTRTVDQQDNYHGTVVADPYRWLEDANSADTQAWVEAQNKLTQSYLSGIPGRDAIQARLTKLWDYERFSVPFKEGGRYFYSRNDGLQNQSVLYTMQTLADVPRLLLDPNTLAADGTVALADLAVSPTGKYLAYSTAASGSDWNEIHVRDIDSGKDIEDVIKWVKFSRTAWLRDGSGFFYSRYDEPKEATKLADVNYFQKLYFHKLGTPQSADVLAYERPDHKDWGFNADVTDDGSFLIISASQGTENKNRIYYKDLTRKDAKVVGLLEDFDAAYDFIGNDGNVFWFRTDRNAPRGRIVSIDIRKPGVLSWKQIVPESSNTMVLLLSGTICFQLSTPGLRMSMLTMRPRGALRSVRNQNTLPSLPMKS